MPLNSKSKSVRQQKRDRQKRKQQKLGGKTHAHTQQQQQQQSQQVRKQEPSQKKKKVKTQPRVQTVQGFSESDSEDDNDRGPSKALMLPSSLETATTVDFDSGPTEVHLGKKRKIKDSWLQKGADKTEASNKQSRKKDLANARNWYIMV
jgi:hypothetical protein